MEAVVIGANPVCFSIRTRMNARMWSATKKKIVGGSNFRNSSLTFSTAFVMARPRPCPEMSEPH